MKLLITIILSCITFLNFSYGNEKKDCKKFKKFTKEYMSCIGYNLKNIAKKGSDKVKKDVNIAADEVKDDASKVKNKTEKLIEKGKEKIN